MKNTLTASQWLVLISISFFLACQNNTPLPTPPVAQDQASSETQTKEYAIRFSTLAPPTAGTETMLIFTPKIKSNDGTMVPLDVQHEKKMHLIVVPDDLSRFEHLHPEIQADGSFLAKTTFENGGKYWLFVDYKPTGADHQLEKISLDVAGKSAVAQTWLAPKTTSKTSDGYSVNLSSEIGKFVDKGETHIIVKITKNGKEIMASGLENHLGSKGHAVMISADSEHRYLHLHPSIEADHLHIAASFEKTGTYRGWLRFQHEGQLQTADFVIKVVEGMGETPEHSHDHGGHTHEHGEHSHDHSEHSH
jgi:hypothetical protein